jgi:hypothetical protein
VNGKNVGNHFSSYKNLTTEDARNTSYSYTSQMRWCCATGFFDFGTESFSQHISTEEG